VQMLASAGVEGVTTLLLREGGSTGINKADKNGMCPIHVAASVGAMDQMGKICYTSQLFGVRSEECT